MQFTAAKIAQAVGGRVVGDSAVRLTGFARADQAKAGDLTFAESDKYFEKAKQGAASAILVAADYPPDGKTLIRVPNARVAFAKVLPLFFPEDRFTPGVDPTALVAKSARIDPTAHIGPLCIVGERTTIGPGAVLVGHNYVGSDCAIAAGSRLFPCVVAYAQTQIGQRVRIHAGSVIGADGFGYVEHEGAHLKIQQIGNVIIHDDVEIGANVTIDRGALGPTVIGRGTKIDNLVQVAHNVIIGEHCLVVAQVGIAGSAQLGKHVTLAGQSGVGGHIKVADGTIVGGQCGVIVNTSEGDKLFGTPAQPVMQAKRQAIALQRLPELLKKVAVLEARLAALEAKTKK